MNNSDRTNYIENNNNNNNLNWNEVTFNWFELQQNLLNNGWDEGDAVKPIVRDNNGNAISGGVKNGNKGSSPSKSNKGSSGGAKGKK